MSYSSFIFLFSYYYTTRISFEYHFSLTNYIILIQIMVSFLRLILLDECETTSVQIVKIAFVPSKKVICIGCYCVYLSKTNNSNLTSTVNVCKQTAASSTMRRTWHTAKSRKSGIIDCKIMDILYWMDKL